jgi:2-methylcitrate dehydratase PrpD
MTTIQPHAEAAVAERIAAWISETRPDRVPPEAVEVARKLFLDVAGLSVAARHEPYVTATRGALEGGSCTVIGHAGGGVDVFGAALVNGTAAHGEDYDDTFEGGPVHCGAVVVPAALAICEKEGLAGDRLLAGIVTGAELLCRLSLVAPGATHRASFHPTAVFGALAAAGAVSSALALPPAAIVSALGIAGSMASGIIEYLAEGAWTKRMHAGWAAQSGLRAALLARGGFVGPRTVFEGAHGVYRAFAPSVQPDFSPLLDGLGRRWVMCAIAFKPYACGTMAQPFVDCAIRLAETGVRAEDVADVVCDVAEGTVHRLWEPLAIKRQPPTPYAAKFSTPFCMALGFFERGAGLAQFGEKQIRDRDILSLASKIRYRINPNDEYPRNFTGHLRATLVDGTEREFRQPHLRGGQHAPLTAVELETKVRDNAVHGGWSPVLTADLIRLSRVLFSQSTLASLERFRA